MGLYEQQIAQGKILARLPQFRWKVNKALSDIAKALEIAQRPYVALSWGKQSSVLMHLVFQVNTLVPGVFWRGPESDIIADFSAVAEKFQQRWKIKYVEQFCEENFKKTASAWQRENGMDCVFIGLCEHESKVRRHTLSKADYNNVFRYKTEAIRCCPLRTWSNQDVAAYIAQHDIPVLSTYRKFGFDVRTAARIKFGTSFTEQGFDLLSGTQQAALLENQAKRKNQ